jgi:RNA polymerase sigma-70 factor, ECF subfamily
VTNGFGPARNASRWPLVNIRSVNDSFVSDDTLLAEARAGNRQALEALLERHQAQLYDFGMKMCGNPEDAKDVLQETLLAMARGIRDFRGESSLSTWLFTIARSACSKMHRRGKFAPDEASSLEIGAAADGLADPGRRADEVVASKQLGRALSKAIGELEPMSREVLMLRDVEGLTAPEVAEVLGVTVQAVKSRLHRARLSVREHLEPLLGLRPDLPRAPGTCPDALTLLSQCLEDELSAELCTQLDRHLETCERCRGACDTLKRTLSLCRASATATEVPAAVQSSVRTAVRACLSESA